MKVVVLLMGCMKVLSLYRILRSRIGRGRASYGNSLTFWGIIELFSVVANIILYPHQQCTSFQISLHSYYYLFSFKKNYYFSHPSGCEMASYSLICISLFTNNVKYLVMYLLAIYTSSLEKKCFCYWVVRVLYVFWILDPNLQIFSSIL